jgi:hypothetical protein
MMFPLSLETYLGKHIYYYVPADHPAIAAVADLDRARLNKQASSAERRALLSVVRASMEADEDLWTFVANFSYNEGMRTQAAELALLEAQNTQDIEETTSDDLEPVDFEEGHVPVSGFLCQSVSSCGVALVILAKK